MSTSTDVPPLLDEPRLRAGLASLSLGSPLVVTRRTASTNADLSREAERGAPHGTVHTTNHQTAGRGRLSRAFEQPDGSGIAVSTLLRPEVDLSRWGWLPLVAGLATREAIILAGVDSNRVGLKWPNDVLVDERKISGILVEAVNPGGDDWAAVVGIGVNVSLADHELPVATATSLGLVGGSTDRTRLIIDLVGALERNLLTWHAGSSVVRDAYRAVCDTIGRDVTVTLPDGSTLDGTATDVDGEGQLVVGRTPVAAGDVIHVRRR